MKLVVFAKDVPKEIFDKAEIVLDVNDKEFTIERHTTLAPHFKIYPNIPSYGKHRHISELKHILLACIKETKNV